MSEIWNAIADSGPAAVVLVVATLALLALPVFRLLAPRNHRNHGGPARLFLIIAALLALAAIGLGTMGATSPGNLVQLVAVLVLMLGLVGIAGVLVFDVTLPRLRIDVPSILRDLMEVMVAVALGMGFLWLAGLDVFSLVTTSAVLTAVIGLALQSTIANVFSGLGLQLDRTLRHGEWIEVGNHIGKILEIGWRSTCIQTRDGDTVFVPNSELVAKEVRKFARPNGAHRSTVRIGFHYRHPPNEVRRVLLEAMRDIPEVLRHPEPSCGPVEFGDFAVIYSVRYWIADFADEIQIDEEVHSRLWYAAQRANLEIPYPIRTLASERAAVDTADAEGVQNEAIHLLAAVAPFNRLDDENQRRCTRNVRRLHFARNETLLRPDGSDDHLYVISAGEVSLRRSSTTPVANELTLRPGDLVGQRLLPGSNSASAYTARSEVTLYQIDDRALQEVLVARPELADDLAAIATIRQTKLEDASHVTHSPGHQSEESSGASRLVPRFRRLFSEGGWGRGA